MRETWAPLLTLGSLLAIAWSILQFYVGYDGTYPTMVVRPWHVTLAAAVAFAAYPLLSVKGETGPGTDFLKFGWPDRMMSALLIVACISIGAYFAMNGTRFDNRMPFVDSLTTMDLLVGCVVIVLVLEATRRTTGMALPIVCLVFLAYDWGGPWLPGELKHSGINFHDFIELQVMSTQGIFGVPVGVSSSYVFYFILFAAFMEVSGGGTLLDQLRACPDRTQPRRRRQGGCGGLRAYSA